MTGPARLVIVLAVVLAGWVAANGALFYRTADFLCLHEGARLVSVGQDPYDEERWRPLVSPLYPDPFRGSGMSSCVTRYTYPLWTAVVMLPFGILPLEVAASLWMAIAIGATIAGTRWIWRAASGSARLAPVFAILVVMSQPFWILLISGQITGLLVGLLGGSVWLASRGRGALSGAALAALMLKPQIAGPFVPALLIREAYLRGSAAVLGAAALAAVLLVVSLAIRPTWIAGWLAEVGGRRFSYIGDLPSAWGLSSELFGTIFWGPILIAAIVAVVLVLLRDRQVGQLTFASIALPVSLLAVPHIWSYDFLILALSWGTALALADTLPGAKRAVGLALTITSASLLPWSMYAVALGRGEESLSALVPACTALVLAAILGMRPATAV